eukprot:4661218-Pyramimonas_sp.AAC.1
MDCCQSSARRRRACIVGEMAPACARNTRTNKAQSDSFPLNIPGLFRTRVSTVPAANLRASSSGSLLSVCAALLAPAREASAAARSARSCWFSVLTAWG